MLLSLSLSFLTERKGIRIVACIPMRLKDRNEMMYGGYLGKSLGPRNHGINGDHYDTSHPGGEVITRHKNNHRLPLLCFMIEQEWDLNLIGPEPESS